MTAALTTTRITGVDDNTAQAGQVAYALSARHFGVGQGHNTTYIPTDAVQPVAFNETAGGNSAHEGISPPVKTGTGGSATSVSVPAMAVRRLTPTECERLQGYPDGWTATSYGRQQADAPRYRQLGNSIAVPVFEWVSGRLVEVDQGCPL